MNRNTRTIAKLAGIIFAAFICALAAYYVSSLTVGHQLATLSNNMTYSRWQGKFFSLVAAAGGLTVACSLLWFILSRWAFTVTAASGVGRRTIWALLAAVSFAGNILIPRYYSVFLGIRINAVVIALFVVLFTVVGYWLVSIFTTPKPYKYTPLGAQIFIRS